MSLGALHVHSTFSDGESSLAELREIFLSAGCSFICMTDHSEAFDPPKLLQYLKQCEALSDERMRFVPGLEYECKDRIHILGYGMTKRLESVDPNEIIAAINNEGGISVVAHPPDRAFAAIEIFGRAATGLEVWNTKYDGQYAPRPSTFALLERLRRYSPQIRAFHGLDLHWKKQFRGMLVKIAGGKLANDEILSALKNGDYSAIKDGVELPASGQLPHNLLARFEAANARSSRFRKFAKDCKSALDRLGIRVPKKIKAQLRRFF